MQSFVRGNVEHHHYQNKTGKSLTLPGSRRQLRIPDPNRGCARAPSRRRPTASPRYPLRRRTPFASARGGADAPGRVPVVAAIAAPPSPSPYGVRGWLPPGLGRRSGFGYPEAKAGAGGRGRGAGSWRQCRGSPPLPALSLCGGLLGEFWGWGRRAASWTWNPNRGGFFLEARVVVRFRQGWEPAIRPVVPPYFSSFLLFPNLFSLPRPHCFIAPSAFRGPSSQLLCPSCPLRSLQHQAQV